MSRENLSNKEIQNYKIRSIIFLVLMLLGMASSFYLYLDGEKHHREIEETNKLLLHQTDSLQKANDRIKRQANRIVNLEEHRKQKEQLESAIEIVQILVNKNTDKEMSTEEILAGLTDMAKEEKAKQDAYIKNREKLIANLFSANENTRTTARRGLSKEYASDPRLVSFILDEANKTIFTKQGSSKQLNTKYLSNISQINYLFTTLSAQNLVPEKARLETFFKELKASNQFRPNGQTMQQIKEVQRKLKSV